MVCPAAISAKAAKPVPTMARTATDGGDPVPPPNR